MMLSKRMTAKRRELKPASQARKRMVKESSDCQPAGCDRPPDSPAGAGFGDATLPAALCVHWAPGPWWPCRLFPRAMRPLHGDELRDDLCLLSGAEGSAMLCPGGGSRFSPPPPPPPRLVRGVLGGDPRRRRRRRRKKKEEGRAPRAPALSAARPGNWGWRWRWGVYASAAAATAALSTRMALAPH